MTDETHDPAEVWRDWTTIWQSEIAGMVQDREVFETIAATTQLWVALAETMVKGKEQDGPGTRARETPGATAAAAASDAGSDETRRLAQRVAELERRLDAMAASVPTKPRRTRSRL